MSKFPFYKQLDAMDCGPTCLRMIARHYGKTFSVQQLREQSYIQRTGVNLLGISEAAASIGLRATGIRTSMEKLKQQSKLPCILHWNQEHFVVLYKVEKKRGKTWFLQSMGQADALTLLKAKRERFELEINHRMEIGKNRRMLELAYENMVNSLKAWDKKYLIRNSHKGMVVWGKTWGNG